jgi:hypothetical protein
MEVVPSGQAGASGGANYITLRNRLVSGDLDAAQMAVHAKEVETMIYDNGFSVDTNVFGKCNPSAISGRDWRVASGCKVYSEMDLIIYDPTLV